MSNANVMCVHLSAKIDEVLEVGPNTTHTQLQQQLTFLRKTVSQAFRATRVETTMGESHVYLLVTVHPVQAAAVSEFFEQFTAFQTDRS